MSIFRSFPFSKIYV